MIFYYVFWYGINLSSKTSFVQPAVGNAQVCFTLYFLTKFICCQDIFFHVLAGRVFYEWLLKVSVLRKIYTIKRIPVTGLNKIAGEIIQSFCFLSFMYSIT